MASKDLVLSCKSKSKILEWHVKPGEIVSKDQALSTYVFTEKFTKAESFITQRKLKAKYKGKVLEILIKPNEEIARGQVVARLQETNCEHNTIMKDLCCDCGADLRREPGIPGDLIENSTASMPVVPNIAELKVSPEEAARLARYDEQQLLHARKLVLVVDLDMTLIHTTVAPVPKDTEDVYSFVLPGHQYEYHTKLRPGAKKFLESISKFYELHIFTMGSRMYAHTVAEFLDPDKKFFAHRIRSRDEFINSFSKFHDLKALFPCGDHMVCIIDDREDVWHYAPNLIVVKPYKFFRGADDINDPFTKNESNLTTDGPAAVVKNVSSNTNQPVANTKNSTDTEIPTHTKNSTDTEMSTQDVNYTKTSEESAANDDKKGVNLSSNVNHTLSSEVKDIYQGNVTVSNGNQATVTDHDDYLFYLDELLERIHFSFYSTLDKVKKQGGWAAQEPNIAKYCTDKTVNPDTRVIVPELRRLTLKGCSIVFTGVVPTKTPLETSRAWRAAISLGACVTPNIVLKGQSDLSDSALCTTHVVAARHGTHKAHVAYKTPEIKLVNPNWLWCASERWEWPDESVFPVPLLEGSRNSPVISRQNTPQHNAFEQKSKKQISPLAKDGFELPGGYDPDHFSDGMNSFPAFSKYELDAMDKEVEELMGENDSSDENDKSLGAVSESGISTPSSNKRKNVESSSSESNSDNDSKTEKLRQKLIKKLKRDADENSGKYSSASSSAGQEEESDNNGKDSENENSGNSDSSSEESDGESSLDEHANSLERQISEVEDT